MQDIWQPAAEGRDSLLRRPVLCAPSDAKTGPAIRPARILVVEDDYLVALEMQHSLVQASFDVVGIAATAEEAFDIAAAAKPDLAVMDIRLAGPRDGIAAALELLTELNVPSIFATAHGDPQTRNRATAAKPLGWLDKPYSAEALVAEVNAALRAKQS